MCREKVLLVSSKVVKLSFLKSFYNGLEKSKKLYLW